MDNLLKYTAESNEIYIVAPPSALVKKQASFDDVARYLLEHRNTSEHALLVGIQRGNPPVMLVNPDNGDFHGLQPDDKLVLIARKRPYFE